MNDRHLETIEKSIISNTNNDELLIYQFEDGFEIYVEKMGHADLKELVKNHGFVKEIKKAGGI